MKQSVRKITHQSGLTLLEVMVALLIFALTGTAVMKAAADHLNAVTQLKEMTFATWVANNRLTRVGIEKSWPPKNGISGNMEMADRTWYWRQRVVQTGDKDLRAIEIDVSLDESFDNSITTVTTYVGNPDPEL